MRRSRQSESARAFNAHLESASRSLNNASRSATEFLGGRDLHRRLARIQAELAGLQNPESRTTEDHDLLPEETQAERSRARRQRQAEERKQRKVNEHGQTEE